MKGVTSCPRCSYLMRAGGLCTKCGYSEAPRGDVAVLKSKDAGTHTPQLESRWSTAKKELMDAVPPEYRSAVGEWLYRHIVEVGFTRHESHENLYTLGADFPEHRRRYIIPALCNDLAKHMFDESLIVIDDSESNYSHAIRARTWVLK